MAAIPKTVNEDRCADEATGDALTRLAERHLVQPWPVSGSIGAEARGRIEAGEGIYVTDAAGRLVRAPVLACRLRNCRHIPLHRLFTKKNTRPTI